VAIAGDSVPVTNLAGSVAVANAGDCATGVDACAGGWVAVTLRPSAATNLSGPLTATVAVAPTLDGLSLAGIVGIDMPLGLIEDGWRVADVLARRALGRRGVTVFAIPPRPVWQQASKHTQPGLAMRRTLLTRAGITLPPRVTGAAEHDLLDAAAVAWSARRITAAAAVTLTSPAQHADDGTEIAIRY
jgi:predicted RNase H-like nuclease